MNDTIQTDSVVTLTESAARQIQSLLAKEADGAGKALRVFVEGGGCSGFQYGMNFDRKQADDLSAEFFGTEVIVDPESAMKVRGAVVDYTEGLTGAGFKISNPNASHSCGCGKSFEA